LIRHSGRTLHDSDQAARRRVTHRHRRSVRQRPATDRTRRGRHFASCLSTDATLTSGLSVTDITLPDSSCTAAGFFADTPYAITWNNGHTSQINLSFTDVVDGTEQVTGAGTVTAGEFTSATVILVWVYPVLNPLQCASAQGVTSQSGTLTAQITSLL
jgi:hypothetical protein